MDLPFGYMHVLIVIAVALLGLVGIYWHRDRWNTPPTRLRAVLSREEAELGSEDTDSLAPLLLYEERYPAFADIIGLVLSRFSLDRLLRGKRFRDNLAFLSHATCREERPEHVQAAMCQIIHALLEDPDIEYRCRPELQELIDRFLTQLEKRGEIRLSQ